MPLPLISCPLQCYKLTRDPWCNVCYVPYGVNPGTGHVECKVRRWTATYHPRRRTHLLSSLPLVLVKTWLVQLRPPPPPASSSAGVLAVAARCGRPIPHH